MTELSKYCKLLFFNSKLSFFLIYTVYLKKMPTISFGFLKFSFSRFVPILMTRKIFGKRQMRFEKKIFFGNTEIHSFKVTKTFSPISILSYPTKVVTPWSRFWGRGVAKWIKNRDSTSKTLIYFSSSKIDKVLDIDIIIFVPSKWF